MWEVADAKILLEIACNGTIVNDNDMGEVIQLQGDQRKAVHSFLIDADEGLALDVKTIKVWFSNLLTLQRILMGFC